MKITKRQLKYIIKESLLGDITDIASDVTGVDVSDIENSIPGMPSDPSSILEVILENLEEYVTEAITEVTIEVRKNMEDQIAEYTKDCTKEEVKKSPGKILTRNGREELESRIKSCVMRKVGENPDEAIEAFVEAVISVMINKFPIS